MLEQTTDVVLGGLGKTSITLLIIEDVLAILPHGRVNMHTGAVVAEDGLGHESYGLAVFTSHVLDDVLVPHHLVRHLQRLGELHVDLALPAGGHLVVMAFDVQAAADHRIHHLGAQILIVVDGRQREIAFLIARTEPEVMLAASRVPASLFGVDEVEPRMLILIETDVVEDEEFGFWSDVAGVGDAGLLQVGDAAFGDSAGVFAVRLLGDRVVDGVDPAILDRRADQRSEPPAERVASRERGAEERRPPARGARPPRRRRRGPAPGGVPPRSPDRR